MINRLSEWESLKLKRYDWEIRTKPKQVIPYVIKERYKINTSIPKDLTRRSRFPSTPETPWRIDPNFLLSYPEQQRKAAYAQADRDYNTAVAQAETNRQAARRLADAIYATQTAKSIENKNLRF